MIYFLTAMGLTPGDSSTVHIYTQHNRHKQYIEQHIYTQTIHRTTQLTQTLHRTTQSIQTIHRTTQQRLVTRHSEERDRRNKICDRVSKF